MAADFWVSSHYKRWIVDRTTVRKARAEDLRYVDDPAYLDYLAIYFANAITKLGKKLGLRQRVIATATVFFRRFYLKNSYCETDPFLVIAACCYVAAKAEESPVHIRTVISDARSLFGQDMYNVKHFPTDNSKLAEMEFYLVDDLECDLTVFHPYRTLLALCKKENDDSTTPAEEGEAGELGSGDVIPTSAGTGNLGVGVGTDEGPRYWGTGEGKLELSAGALQTAWFIINDTYRSDICLLYPPHLIAIAAIYLTFILHAPTRANITPLLSPPSTSTASSSSSSRTPPAAAAVSTPTPEDASTSNKLRRSSRHASHTSTSSTTTTEKKPAQQDPITFLSELNVSLPLIATLSQEIISLYTLWDRYKEDAHPEAKVPAITTTTNNSSSSVVPTPASTSDTPTTTADTNTLLDNNNNTNQSADDPVTGGSEQQDPTATKSHVNITPAFLSGLLLRMREARVMDSAHGNGNGHSHSQQQQSQSQGQGHTTHARGQGQGQGQGQQHTGRMGGRGVVNKMLERTQAAG